MDLSGEIGGRSSRGAAHSAIAATTGFRLTLHRREEALAKAIQRWDSLPSDRLPHRIMLAARAGAAMGQQWRRAARDACAGTSVNFPQPAAPLPRYIANRIITGETHARQAAERAAHDAGKPHMAFFDAVLARQAAWGAPPSATVPRPARCRPRLLHLPAVRHRDVPPQRVRLRRRRQLGRVRARRVRRRA